MSDRDNVIKALECRKNVDKRCGNPCEESGMCHYATAVRDINGEIYRPFICDRERICVDALALLKEQEGTIKTLEDKNKKIMLLLNHQLEKEREQETTAEIEGGGSTWWYVCSECHGAIDKNDRFCRYCGRSVK